MTGPNDPQSELQDAGDAWLTFLAIFVLTTAIVTAVLWQYISFYLSLAGALPVAVVIGWAISLIRPVRRVISEIVQWLFDSIAIFS
jgi:hypothetical protein